MRRRLFVSLACIGVAAASAALAQRPARAYRVGVLNATDAETNAVMLGVLRDGLAERGYVVGRNLTFDESYADGRLDRLPELARNLVARHPDVIVTYTTRATQALAEVTTEIPIVMTLGNDPVSTGLTSSLARPSRNVTGFSNFSESLAPKRLDYLLQVAPSIGRLGLVYGDNSGEFLRASTETAARSRSIAVVPIQVHETAGVVPALAAALDGAAPIDALLVNADPIVYPATVAIAAFTEARRLPAMYALRQMSVDGGMMALSYDPFENVRGTADYVARLLAGAAVASLPFQQPRRTVFTLNLAALHRAGIAVPPALIALADEVIE